jgi:hypothetical protein
MNFVVRSQFAEQPEILFASRKLTNVSIFANMLSFVFIKIAILSECFVAEIAFVRSFATVCPRVTFLKEI